MGHSLRGDPSPTPGPLGQPYSTAPLSQAASHAHMGVSGRGSPSPQLERSWPFPHLSSRLDSGLDLGEVGLPFITPPPTRNFTALESPYRVMGKWEGIIRKIISVSRPI